MSEPEPALLRRGVVAMQRCGARLRRSLARLDAFFPIEADRLPELTPARQDDIDAFLKRFEQLVLTLQDQVFVGLAIREAEDPREMSRRDVVELMERLGAIPSARQFRDLFAVRNRLAHLYPEDPARQGQTSTPRTRRPHFSCRRASVPVGSLHSPREPRRGEKRPLSRAACRGATSPLGQGRDLA